MRVRVADDRLVTRFHYTTSSSVSFGKVENLAPSAEDRPRVVQALVEALATLGVRVETPESRKAHRDYCDDMARATMRE